MTGLVRVALGSLAGGAIAAAAAPFTKPFFSAPTGGVGALTIHGYPKSWDYAVVALLFLGAFVGGLAALGRRASSPRAAGILPDGPPPPSLKLVGRALEARRPLVWSLSAIVFVLMLFVHDHPYAHMDHFHEGEHLTAGWLMKEGARPYGDFYVFHGLAVDAGLDALVLGDPPSPLRPRRLQTVLDALTLALLVPIAAELSATAAGLALGVFASLCATAAFWLPVFPYFRMAPALLAALAMLRYVRSGSPLALFAAAASGTLGVLWSLDTGLYALAGVVGSFAVVRVLGLEARPLPLIRAVAIGAVALALPFVVLLAVRADITRFVTDSFVIMPRAIDAIWSLPAPARIDAESLRYYLPPAFYGLLAALALLARRNGAHALAARLAIATVFSLLLFRSATGRVSWSHTRFALPLLGIALAAFVFEPLVRERRWRSWRGAVALALAVPLFFHLQVAENVAAGVKLLGAWPQRQRHDGMVPYPFATGRGLYTGEQNAIDLASLASFIDSLGPRETPVLDFSNERALYYLLQRKPATRVMEISMLSVPELLAEAMGQLEARPPLCVIVQGYPEIAAFDGVTNAVRVPQLAAWIDANYPRRTQIGRFVVAHK
jgi:hypothetical protein